ncbi:MAG: cytochrome P450 [Halobacteriales archaeon]
MASRSQPPAGGEEKPLPPGPSGLPWLGKTLQLVRDPFAFYDRVESYGDVVCYTVAGQRFCALLHPDHVEHVLVEQPERYRRWMAADWDVFSGFGSEGLLLSHDEQWRRQRQLLQGAFTPDRLQSYAGSMVAHAERTVSGWEDGETVAINRDATRLTLEILTTSLFDLDVSEDRAVVADAARALNERADTGLSTFLPGWLPTPSNRRYHRRMAAFEDMVEALIDERRAAPEAGDDLLTLLLTAGEDDRGLSRTEVVDNVVTFLFAGHETTSLALTYTLFLLARHPEAQRKLRDEVDTVLDGDAPTAGAREQLDYTERVIKEALRLYPPAYVQFREVTEPSEIGGYAIPEGTKLSLPQFHIQTDGRFYDDPDTFRPDRWTPEFEASLPDYAYFPFGGGPRHCIGMRFARLELELVLPVLIDRANFELVSDPDLDFQLGITMQPTSDIELRVEKR